ncbi:MAG: DUF86 domain-containing protein [Alphaproteobacteria bacterium]|nr:DUF86 domain-containing protein [Alphaproteobacteria bacterium]
MLSDKRLRALHDILDNIVRIERFIGNADFALFSSDERLSFAVLHALLIISEAGRRLGPHAESVVPGQPWSAIRALGNILRHEYEGVDLGTVWSIIIDDLPTLKAAVAEAIEIGPS